MSLTIGRLGQSSVDFGMTMATPNPSPEQHRQAAKNIKSDASGLALSLVCIGQSSSLFPPRNFTTVPIAQCLLFPQGIGIWFTTYIYMATRALTGERNAKRIREHYILRRDVAYFGPSGGTGEVTTRIQRDTRK